MTIEIGSIKLDKSDASKLLDFLKMQYSGVEKLELTHLSEFDEGWETDLIRVSVRGIRDGLPWDRDLVFRLYKGVHPIEKAQKEHSLMVGVSRYGVTTPRVDALVTDPSILGHPFLVMEYVAGGTLADKIQKAEALNWLNPMAETQAKIHSLPWSELIAEPEGPVPQPDEPLGYVKTSLQQMDETVERYGLSGFEPTMAWLHEREALGTSSSPVLVHNDFHPQNILIREGEMMVIDWSFADVSDYRMDLAWTTMLLSVMVGDEHRQPMLEAYERISGSPIENLEYFEVLKYTTRMLTIASWLDDSVAIPVAGITRQAIRGDYKVHVLNPYRRLKDITGLEIRTIEEL